MLNFRKLRQDFSSSILKEGKEFYEKELVVGAKIVHLDGTSLRLGSRVRGAFKNIYECEIEIDRNESIAVDSNCDCSYSYDCQHIAALLFYLEQNLDEIVVSYSQEADIDKCDRIDDKVKKELKETFEEAATKEVKRKGEEHQKGILSEYISAARELGRSPFCLPPESLDEDKAELAIVFTNPSKDIFQPDQRLEIQLALRLTSRSKPLYIPNIKTFFDAVRYREPLTISGRRYFLTNGSFDPVSWEILGMIVNHAHFHGSGEERYMRVVHIDPEPLGAILARLYDIVISKVSLLGAPLEKEPQPLPCLFYGNLEEPFCFSTFPAEIRFSIEYLETLGPTFLLNPTITIGEETLTLEKALLFESAKPGLIYKNTYYRFQPKIRRIHLRSLSRIRDITIPEPLFGTFIENALPVLRKYAEVTNPEAIEAFVTLPYVGKVKGRCAISYLNGELDAELFFIYDDVEIPAALSKLEYKDLGLFNSSEGILARNLVEENRLTDAIFQDFLFDEKEGVFRVKSEKKIVEFMTETVPGYQDRIQFECPENLSDQFIYDQTTISLSFRESDQVDSYEVKLVVDGYLEGVEVDLLWDCIAAKKRFIELQKSVKKGMPRILVLDLDRLTPTVQFFDEIGITKIENRTEKRPLWSLTSVCEDQFKELSVKCTISKRLKEIQKQILGESQVKPEKIPEQIKATLRNYQVDGVSWLERLRRMHLNGILADDMGLGKTLQAIIAITQNKAENPGAQALIICPTSLVYNWKEEFVKFHPELKILVIDGVPAQRRKLLNSIAKYDAVITSYNLLQKDIDTYKKFNFDYAILDEAQHIKNRMTRNAKSVKMLQATHKLILTGTPIENSLDELWSLFDFLMPGLLSSYDRFVEKYIRTPSTSGSNQLQSLRKKVSPFILRRMKEDVLDDLPPVSEILYHCHLTETQEKLYQSYAASAKKELSKLVKKEGFEKIHIHVLATLTRLKQICCHPAIFAKEKAEEGDSAKYDMLMELLPSLIEGNHKAVIFSQYTKMLAILREDLKLRGIPFSYLDGSSKNRLDIVNQFNEDPEIPIFLVSLKAGGTGLNLVGADTVIHYDMWWNPAVENQATDRVHRIGQKKSVSSYKLITLNTIEEKILNLQNRKKGLVKRVISSDDEAISKLTWEEVLELLQT